ncbi:hypothetical protein DFP72DRAFT_821268, partial [Ephemerocybe angulata]
MLRPEELSGVCLYDWIQCSVRKSVVGIKNPSQELLLYHPGHPLRNTHRVLYDVGRTRTVVPNLLGPYLPKADGDDRDYYCCTILTLFVPWRSPMELRSSSESWSETFVRASILPRHLQIISNMNIRHECYDARDDYHAQLKQQVAAQQNPGDELETEDEEDECPDGVPMDVDLDVTDDRMLGVWSQKKRDQMMDMEAVMQSAGWMVNDQSTSSEGLGASFAPERMLGPTKWKSIVS